MPGDDLVNKGDEIGHWGPIINVALMLRFPASSSTIFMVLVQFEVPHP